MSAFIPPDWRDASAYPAKVNEWSMSQWVWAFLRRNSEYQKDYEHFSSLPSYHANGAKTSKWNARATHYYDDAELRYCKHPILPDETVVEYVARTGDDTPRHFSIEDHLLEKWGIICLADPAYDKGNHCIVFDARLPKVIEDRRIFDVEKNEFFELPPEKQERFEETLRFDLRYSIDKQLQYAKDYLMRCKECQLNGVLPFKEERKKGINRKNLPQYLRAYDAHRAGASLIETAKYIFPERKISSHSKYDSNHDRSSNGQLAYRAVLTGRKLVKGGYKDLLELF